MVKLKSMSGSINSEYEGFITWLDEGNYPSEENCDDCNDDCAVCKYNLVGLDDEGMWEGDRNSTQEEFIYRADLFVQTKMERNTLDPWDALNGYLCTVLKLYESGNSTELSWIDVEWDYSDPEEVELSTTSGIVVTFNKCDFQAVILSGSPKTFYLTGDTKVTIKVDDAKSLLESWKENEEGGMYGTVEKVYQDWKTSGMEVEEYIAEVEHQDGTLDPIIVHQLRDMVKNK